MSWRHDARCVSNEIDILYPAVPPPDQTSPDATAALAGAIERLADVLNALPNPLDSAISEFTAADVSSLMRPMPLNARRHMLEHLRIGQLAPRSVPPALCRDVVARMRSGRPHEQTHAARMLTAPVRREIVIAAALHARDGEQGEIQAQTRLDRWPERVLRIGLWVELRASCDGARLLAWAGTQPWWLPPALSTDHGQAVLDVATRVIEASPGFVMPGGNPDVTPPDNTHDDDHDGAGEQDMDTPQHTEASATTEEVEGGADDVPSGPGAAAVLAWAQPALAQLMSSWETAKQAAAAVSDNVAAGRAPAEEALTSIVAFGDGLRSVLERMAEAHDDLAGLLSIGDMASAVDELSARAANEDRRARVADLRRLRATPGFPQVAAAVEALHELLSSAEGPGDALDALLALRDLVKQVARGDSDAAALFALQQRAMMLPQPLQVLTMAAALRQVTLVGLTEPVPATPPPVERKHPAMSTGRPVDIAATQAELMPLDLAEAEPAEQVQVTADTALDQSDHAPAIESPVASEPPATIRQHTSTIAAEQPDQTEQEPIRPPQIPVREEDINSAVAALIVDGRLGLAAEIAEAARHLPARVTALRLAALAEHVRSETGPTAARVRGLLASGPAAEFGSEDLSVTVAVPALLRTALVTGDPAAGALLINLAPRLEPHLRVVAEQIGQRALKGVLVGGTLRAAVSDTVGLEAALTRARQAARDARRPRKLRFKRATDIAAMWIAPDGLLGRLLTAAEHDDRNRMADVSTEVIQLSDHATVTKHLNTADRQFRGHGSHPVEGPSRTDLYTLVSTTLDIVSGWLEAVAALEAVQQNRQWSTTELTEMRAAVRAHTAGALAELDAKAHRGKALPGAAAVYARYALADTLALLDATTPPAAEPNPAETLTGELLKVTGAVMDELSRAVNAPSVTLPQLLIAANKSWPEAFDAKLAEEDYASAQQILDGCTTATLPGAAPLDIGASDRLAAAEQRSRAEINQKYVSLLGELRNARMHNEVSAEQDDELTALLTIADPPGRNLGAVRRQLATVAQRLPAYRQEAAQRLRARLTALQQRGDIPEFDRLSMLIDDGELSTADELIYGLETGEEVPKPYNRKDFDRFFPGVPNALGNGITNELIKAVEGGTSVPECQVLDFSDLSRDARQSIADALRAWFVAARTPVEGRAKLDERATLLPALRLVGYDFAPGARVTPQVKQRGKERRLIEITDVTYTGKAMLPQFGSGLHGRLRVLMCWGQPAEDLLLSWIDQDPEQRAVLVAHFGTMPAVVRRRLAARALSTEAPVAVVDDAALAYLAAHGGRQLDAAMTVLAPFTSVQPYARKKRSLVPPEMFYGRDLERRGVLDPEGTQIIYGGRGLGKSALLRDAKAAFEKVSDHVGVYVDLKATEIGPDRQAADAMWNVLLRDLREAGVLLTRGRGRMPRGDSYDQVRAGVREWLAADPQRRLLVLLDESDHFFEVDAPHFIQTNRLKDLGALSGVEGRAKVVFAGLHSVQRFARVSNQTFKHLAQQPTIVGPLRPQFAYNLMTRPLGVLGYVFERDDLVHRVLGLCSYQPFLLQMFAHRLVEHMHEKRRAGLNEAQPPYVVTRADIDAVEQHTDLKRDIAETFSDTLNLDPRYYVVANVLAWHAHERGLDARLNERELREECRLYWPTGFTTLDMEGFRTYLQEMVGLGVLAPNNDGRGWHLRSPNTLRMIGTRDQVSEQLLTAEEQQVQPDFLALESRRRLGSGTAPLTAKQVDDVLGDHSNQVRVVLGSVATGVGKVAETVREVCGDLADRYILLEPSTRRQFDAELIDGEPGSRRVVLSDLSRLEGRGDTCAASLEAAMSQRPTTPGVTRAVALVCGTGQLPFWRELLGREDADQVTVMLRRFTAPSLRVWTLEEGRSFTSEQRRVTLLEVTDGWPLLVDRAAELAAQHQSEDAALRALETELATPARAAHFLDEVGVTVDAEVAAALEAVVTFTEGTAMPWTDLVDAAELSGLPGLDATSTMACLDALGVFDIKADGNYQVSPLIMTCWPHRQLPVAL